MEENNRFIQEVIQIWMNRCVESLIDSHINIFGLYLDCNKKIVLFIRSCNGFVAIFPLLFNPILGDREKDT